MFPNMDAQLTDALTILLRNESRKRLYRDISLTQILFGPIFFIMFTVVLQVRLTLALYFVFWMTLTGLVGFCMTQFLMPRIFLYPNVVPCTFVSMLFSGLLLGIATVTQGTLLLATPYLKGTYVNGKSADEDVGLGPAIGIGALLTCLEVVAIVMVLRDLMGCSRYRLGLQRGRSLLRRPPNSVAPWTNYRIVQQVRTLPLLPGELSLSDSSYKNEDPPDYALIPPPTYDEAIKPDLTNETEATLTTNSPTTPS